MAFSNPPESHKVFQSLISGLRKCCLIYAIEQNPVKCKVCINDFWENAVPDRTRPEGEAIVTTVRGTPVVVTEQTIREVLRFGDQPAFPTEFPKDKIVPVLKRMGYEGSSGAIKKKLSHHSGDSYFTYSTTA